MSAFCTCHFIVYEIIQVCIHIIYIYKEGVSRTVVREVLPRATAHGHQTFPDYGRHTRSRSKGGDVREEAPAEERAAKNLQTTVRHLGFTEKIYGFPCTLLCCQYKRRTPTVVRELLPRTSTKRAQTFSAVERCTSHQYKVVEVLKCARRAGLSASYNIILAMSCYEVYNI